MGKSKENIVPKPYPTDRVGEPIHPYELGFTPAWETDTLTNNHHHAFYAKRFGATAIGFAYRNLEAMQTQLDIAEHVDLHRHYSGMPLPKSVVMLDRIAEELDEGGSFQVWNFATKEYEQHPIRIDHIEELERAYRGTE